MSDSASATTSDVWVFHRGALGDAVMLWPVLRAIAQHARPVTLVTDASKARLAEIALGVRGLNAERPEFNALWTGEPVARLRAAEVHAWLGDPADPAMERWSRAARAMFEGARVIPHPGRPDRALALSGTQPARASNPLGAMVIHVGAGAEAKRWPMERWAQLAAWARSRGISTRVIAGEVEQARLSAAERSLLQEMGGQWVETLEELLTLLRGARAVVAADTGPAHLAAQLGLPTLTLFGPTDPARWAPVGPAACTLAPPQPCAMDWLTPASVWAALRRILDAGTMTA